MRDIASKNNINIALLLFFLPLLSYVHIFFNGDNAIWMGIDESSLLFNYTNYANDIEYLVYYTSYWFSIILIFLIFSHNSMSWIKPFILFPLFLAFTKFSLHTFPFLKYNKVLFYSISIVIFMFFFFFESKKNSIFQIKERRQRSIFKLIVICLLISVPFIHELWRLYPNNTQTLNVLFFTISSNGFLDANFALYVYLHKMCILIPITIFFFLIKKWWRYALLSPIIIYSAQLYNIIFVESSTLDEIEISQTAKFTLPLLFGLIVLAKLNDNQEKISTWLENQYSLVEDSVKAKFTKRETLIVSKRNQISKSKLAIKDLEKIKEELEIELKKT